MKPSIFVSVMLCAAYCMAQSGNPNQKVDDQMLQMYEQTQHDKAIQKGVDGNVTAATDFTKGTALGQASDNAMKLVGEVAGSAANTSQSPAAKAVTEAVHDIAPHVPVVCIAGLVSRSDTLTDTCSVSSMLIDIGTTAASEFASKDFLAIAESSVPPAVVVDTLLTSTKTAIPELDTVGPNPGTTWNAFYGSIANQVNLPQGSFIQAWPSSVPSVVRPGPIAPPPPLNYSAPGAARGPASQTQQPTGLNCAGTYGSTSVCK